MHECIKWILNTNDLFFSMNVCCSCVYPCFSLTLSLSLSSLIVVLRLYLCLGALFSLHLGSQKPLHLLWEINWQTTATTKKKFIQKCCVSSIQIWWVWECVRRVSFVCSIWITAVTFWLISFTHTANVRSSLIFTAFILCLSHLFDVYLSLYVVFVIIP